MLQCSSAIISSRMEGGDEGNGGKGDRCWEGETRPHLLHVRVEARSSLYLWTDSSLKRVFTLLMWVARLNLDRQQSWQITEEARAKSSPRADESRPPSCLGVVLTSQTCGFVRRYIATLWGWGGAGEREKESKSCLICERQEENAGRQTRVLPLSLSLR